MEAVRGWVWIFSGIAQYSSYSVGPVGKSDEVIVQVYKVIVP